MPSKSKPTANKAAQRAVPGNRYALFFFLAIFGAGIDLWTKHVLFQWLGMPGEAPERWIVEGFFGFQTMLNTGALFGIGQGMVWLFATLSVVAGLGVLYWLFVARAANDLWLTVTLGLISAGIMGNLYDRLGLWSVPGSQGEPIYAVRDWILFRFGTYSWPNFNLADCYLVCGAALLFLHALLQPKEEKP